MDFQFNTIKPKKKKKQMILAGVEKEMMLHSQYIINLDLKSRNVLLDNNFKPKEIDLDFQNFMTPFSPKINL